MEKKNQRTILLSATRMSMFLQCKWKYWCNYVLHLPKKSNASFKLGLAVHESLAVAGEIWQLKEKFTSGDIKKIKNMYNKVAAREGIEDTSIYSDGLSMVMSRVNNFANGKILTVEDRFRVSTNEGVMLIGAMDKVEALSDSTILVTDYKTSKYFETAGELKSDIQLSIYDVVANLKYPEYERIVLSLDYLRGDPVYTYRTEQERQEFSEYMLAVYKEMIKLKKEDAAPTLNDMCNWCDFTDNCTAYQEALSSKSFIKKKPDEYNDEELVREYLDIKSKKRIIDNRERKLKEYILKKIQSNGENLVGQNKELYVRQNSSTSYDPKSVYEAVGLREFLKLVSINKKSTDLYMDKNPSIKSQIISNASKRYTSPFVAYKNISK